MRNLFKLAGLSLVTAAVACASSPAEMKDPPILKVTSPQRALIQQGAGKIEVRGEVAPNAAGDPVTKVLVNGVEAYIGEGGNFSATIDVKPGATLIQTIATDAEGGKASDTRAVQAGELRGPGAMVDEALAVAISDDSLKAMGRAAGGIMKATDMAPILMPLNPMVNVGLDDLGQEDCLFAKVSVHDVNMSDAIIEMAPVAGGLQFSMEIKDMAIPMHARYKAACVGGENNISVSAKSVKVSGILEVTPKDGSFDVKLTQKRVVLTQFHMDADGVPGAVLDILPLDKAAEFIIEKGAEMFMGPMVNKALGAAAGVKTVDVMGKKLDIEVFPADVYFDPSAAHVVLSTRMKVQGTESSKGFVYTPNSAIDLSAANGFKFGLADDAANQLLAGFTAAGMLNLTQAAPGGSFDSASISASMAPMISADPKDGKMKVIAGDLIMTFLSQGKPVAKAALNAKIDLKVTGAGESVKVDLGKPEVFINILEDEANLTGFEADDLEKLVGLSLGHQLEVISAALGQVQLPAMPGMTVKDLSVAGENGYVVISGKME